MKKINEKVLIDIQDATRLINHGCVVLITSRSEEKTNVMTLAWITPSSVHPPMLVVAISKKSLTEKLIKEKKEFVVNVPNAELIHKVIQCGKVSGREIDKIKNFGFHLKPATKVSTSFIEECFAHLECKVEKWITSGDHTLFIANILSASIKKGLFEGVLQINLKEAKTIHHLGKNFFTLPGDLLDIEKFNID